MGRNRLLLTGFALISAALLVGIAASAGMAFGRGHMGGMGGMMGGGTNSSSAAVTTGGTANTVDIRNFAFSPGNLQVPVGATVTFKNYDSAPHTATAKDGSWDTGILNQGQSKTITFDRAGDYTYYCKIHPNMVARLRVG
ncbi:MAG: cupredoxin family copper-binding protein [Chloroflexota bacterium]|nr:cupredoxin family copper-binding protein [Chloroflexota bacterium]